ncbi:Hint domain-containing protein [Sulfitobacter sp. JB4-11]|uniref:Hint domain-containing protein n=1 Tax=Sulfitobacter rhodophyticola TaxID=3238304 RepID=UPI003515BB1D
MVQTTSTMIFIGNLPIIDTDESDPATENVGALAGTYVDSEMQMVDVTNFDQDGDGVIWSDEMGTTDYVTYTLRDQTETTTAQDAIIIYSARITEDDGTIHDVEVSVIQMPNGDTFVNDYGAQGTTDGLFIDSIELIAPVITGSAGRNTYATTSSTTICFVQGTLISTPPGLRRIETLAPGALVDTLDGGTKPIIWRRRQQRRTKTAQSPIQIEAGALGCGLPERSLRVSPQHRIMINAKAVRRMFGVDEVLIPAKRLLPLPGIRQITVQDPVCYWHILLDEHAIVFSEGSPVETLWPGPEARKSIPRSVRLPEIGQMQSARLVPEAPRQRQLIARLAKNGQPCLNRFARS